MTIYGLPIQSWLLMLVSVGLGLLIVLVFYKNNRNIGHSEEDEVDYGNISIRGPEPGQLIISGTQTGHLQELSEQHYALVTEADADANRVACRGRVRASSETLTHAAIWSGSSTEKFNAALPVISLATSAVVRIWL